MSNSKPTKTLFNLNSSFGQKKRKTTQMSSRAFDNQIIEQIVSDLPLNRKLELRSVNKQFKRCVDQTLAKEESIQFVNTYGKDVDLFLDNYNKNRIDLSKIGYNFDDKNHCLVQLLSKFEEIKRLEFDNNIRIDNRMIDWILKRFPKLSSLSLLDYRCNYLKFDWMSIGDRLSHNLVSLNIECRLNQHILAQTLADLVAKLYRLQELTIVCPRRQLNKVFAALGPNLVKLRITYCLGFFIDEIMALINGNGRHLKELDISFQTYGYKFDQNEEFVLICNNLLDLKSFKFNHKNLSAEALAHVSNLKKLKKFKYNYFGYLLGNTSRHSMVEYEYKYFDFRSFESSRTSIESLSLMFVELRPQIMFNWRHLFPNIRHLYLKCIFVCGCQTNLFGHLCTNCLRLCFTYLSELKSLRSIDFGESANISIVQNFLVLQQIQFLKINCYLLEERSYLVAILTFLIKMAHQRNGRPLFVELYHIRYSLTRMRRYLEYPPNLKITFQLYSDNKN